MLGPWKQSNTLPVPTQAYLLQTRLPSDAVEMTAPEGVLIEAKEN